MRQGLKVGGIIKSKTSQTILNNGGKMSCISSFSKELCRTLYLLDLFKGYLRGEIGASLAQEKFKGRYPGRVSFEDCYNPRIEKDIVDASKELLKLLYHKDGRKKRSSREINRSLISCSVAWAYSLVYSMGCNIPSGVKKMLQEELEKEVYYLLLAEV